jgi:iron complex transport system permease protein
MKAAASVAIVAMTIALAAASVLTGAEDVSVQKAWNEWRADADVAPNYHILTQQRLPRACLALLAGAGLALAGCSFQALLRNPLATPYTLGIASWGAFGAWVATILVQTAGQAGAGSIRAVILRGEFLGFSIVQAFAFAFCLFNVAFIYYLANQRERLSPAVLLLAGVTMGMFANAGIMLMRFFALPSQLVNMDRWLMGGVDLLGGEPVMTLVVGIVPCAAVLLLHAGQFDQLGFGTELAAGRGVNVRRLQATTFLVCSLMTAVIVSKVGPIGFVGLIVPHAVRSVTGSRHRLLMPLSMAAGGGFLCFCDVAARQLFHAEVPIGIVTAILGGPFFLVLLVRRRFTDWD